MQIKNSSASYYISSKLIVLWENLRDAKIVSAGSNFYVEHIFLSLRNETIFQQISR